MATDSEISVLRVHRELGIPEDYESRTGLKLQTAPTELVSIGPDIYGREQRMAQPAASAWFKMKKAATQDSVLIEVVSAYRSFEYQVNLIKRRLARDESIQDILTRIAAPGYSEHQSGRALDLTTEGYEVLEDSFEKSEAFSWLRTNAARFDFVLSYPSDNPHGVTYEPWHWCYRPN